MENIISKKENMSIISFFFDFILKNNINRNDKNNPIQIIRVF